MLDDPVLEEQQSGPLSVTRPLLFQKLTFGQITETHHSDSDDRSMYRLSLENFLVAELRDGIFRIIVGSFDVPDGWLTNASLFSRIAEYKKTAIRLSPTAHWLVGQLDNLGYSDISLVIGQDSNTPWFDD